ncbi:ABC transporter substrate-binding protein [Reyranella sp.]|jgi:NitT/TauT family transport system substrate-binding protein|uniref:ABC transporter substrate-binding protein n=1 Tax=Reyranella sp. TaxID=1929291 RepID=UPI003D0A3EC9
MKGFVVGAAFAAVLLSAFAASAQTPPLKKAKFGVGTLTLNITYPWAMLPPVLGYWKEEGYEIEVFAAQSSLQGIQLMSAGNVDFVEANSAPIMQAAADIKIPIKTIMVNTVIDWSLVSAEAGPVQKLSDFKGKTIGVASLGTGGVPLLHAFLQANGLKQDDDYALVAVGGGPGALEALRSNRVQGLMFWGSAITSFEVAGGKFRYFHDPMWRQYPDFSVATLQSTIDRDPKMVEAMVRGGVKASLFAATNPDCVRKIQWAKYPDTKPTGGNEATQIKGDLHRLAGQMDGMKQALDMAGGKLWGAATPKNFADLEQVFLETKVLKQKIANPANYLIGIPNFFEKVNDFDHAAIVKQAQECKIP